MEERLEGRGREGEERGVGGEVRREKGGGGGGEIRQGKVKGWEWRGKKKRDDRGGEETQEEEREREGEMEGWKKVKRGAVNKEKGKGS